LRVNVKKNENENENKRAKQMYLFRRGIHPSDVVQGALGDCWLLAAIACLAEFPGAIEHCFCSSESNERHKYYIKLFDARKGVERFKKFYIDDYIPCDPESGRPIFANPKGNELWVLLLEKAFAKFCGNYGRLDGGHTLWAFQAMTGNHCMRLEYDLGSNGDGDEESEEKEDEKEDESESDGEEEEEEEESESDELSEDDVKFKSGPCWRKWLIEYDRAIHETNPREDYGWIDSGEAFDNKRLWVLLRKYDKFDALIAASATNNGEKKREDGIVEGHAYTVKQVFSFKKHKLLNIRNPWGCFEWNGKWSDGDKKRWNRYKRIAKKVKFEAKNDGSFWMEYCDFLNIFNVIEICDRTTIQNLHLSVNEDAESKYKLGILKGFFAGCWHFWCCCHGMKYVYCGRKESSVETIQTKNKWIARMQSKLGFEGTDHGKSWIDRT